MADNDIEDFKNLVPQRIVVDAETFEFLTELIADDADPGTESDARAGDAAAEPVEVRVAAYAAGEHISVTVPAAWESRVKALEAVTQYGPSYQRRVVDTLVDVNHQVRSGYLDLAERGLEYCERIANS